MGGPKRIVDRAQSKDRARVGGVNRPIPVWLAVFRARKSVSMAEDLRNREARVQESSVESRVAEVGRTHPDRA